MAFETEDKVSTGQRIGKALEGAVKGVDTVMDWQARMEQARQGQERIAMQKEQHAQQMEFAKADATNKAWTQLSAYQQIIASSNDPKAASELYYPRAKPFMGIVGRDQTLEEFTNEAAGISKLIAEPAKLLYKAQTQVRNTTLSREVQAKVYGAGLQALKEQELYLPKEQYDAQWKALQDGNDAYHRELGLNERNAQDNRDKDKQFRTGQKEYLLKPTAEEAKFFNQTTETTNRNDSLTTLLEDESVKKMVSGAGKRLKGNLLNNKFINDVSGGLFKGQLTPEQKEFKRETELAFQAARKVITGAQASDKELNTLRPTFLGPTDDLATFKFSLKYAYTVNKYAEAQKIARAAKSRGPALEQDYIERNAPDADSKSLASQMLVSDLKLSTYLKENIPEFKGKQAKRDLSPIDKQALTWANANPKDPRAAEIKQRLGQ